MPVAEKKVFLRRILAPYGDCKNIDNAPLNAFGPSLAFDRLQKGIDLESNFLLLQRIMPPAYRAMLAEAIDEPTWAAFSPLAIEKRLRSEEWQTVCDYVANANLLSPMILGNLTQLLLTLGYHELTLALLRPYESCPIKPDRITASLCYTFSAVRYILSIQMPHYRPDDVAVVANRAEPGSRAQVLATSRMLMWAGRFATDIKLVEEWRNKSQEALELASLEPTSFFGAILWSRHYRAACFLPMLKKDYEKTQEELILAEKFARSAQYNDRHERILFSANLYPVLQSTNRLSLMLGDIHLALSSARQLVDIDPLYSTAAMDYALTLVQAGRSDEAFTQFDRAIVLGPPVSIFAAFSAGSLHEQQGNAAEAKAYYVLAANHDPLSPSVLTALERLRGVLDPHLKRAFQALLQRLENLTSECEKVQL
jgi:tetratricopeptide (TPR) repeat protein